MEPLWFKLDVYPYDLLDVFDKGGRYAHTVAEIDFENMLDPSIHDLTLKIFPGSSIFANGRYFGCKELYMTTHDFDGTASLRIIMVELMGAREAT